MHYFKFHQKLAANISAATFYPFLYSYHLVSLLSTFVDFVLEAGYSVMVLA